MQSKLKSKKAKALVLGLVLKRQGIGMNDLKKAVGGNISDRQLKNSLKSLEQEGRICKAEARSGPAYVPTDLLHRISDSVMQAGTESQIDARKGRRLPSSLLEALKERRNAKY